MNINGCDTILHGKGTQLWFTQEYEDDRNDALLDRTKFTDAELVELDVPFPKGAGRHNPDSFNIKQFPFPTLSKIRQKKVINVRDVLPKIA